MIIFGNTAKKLKQVVTQAEKALRQGKNDLAQKELQAAANLIGKYENEASIEFLSEMLRLATLLAMIGQGEETFGLLMQCIQRAETHGTDRTAVYALICMKTAFFLRTATDGCEQEGMELLEKGMRSALQGDKEQLNLLLHFLSKYLDEVVEYGLADWLPQMLVKAREAYERACGPDSNDLAAALTKFAEAMVEPDIAEGKSLALEAIEQACRIDQVTKIPDQEDMEGVKAIKARLLIDNGRSPEAAKVFREIMATAKGENLALATVSVANIEDGLGKSPTELEALLRKSLNEMGDDVNFMARALLTACLGRFAGMRGDVAEARKCARQIEDLLAESINFDEKDIDEENESHEKKVLKLECIETIARGLSQNSQFAIQLLDEALSNATELEADFPLQYQDAQITKALALSRMGRHQEAEAVVYDSVLERLDDINCLDSRRHADALISLADVLIEKKELARAKTALKGAWSMAAESAGPQSSVAAKIYLMMGKLLMRANDRAKAAESLKRAHSLIMNHAIYNTSTREIFSEWKEMPAKPQAS